jgi:DNA-binding MarR family transcriptional regulator
VDSSDERARLVSISAKGRKLITKVEPDYYREIDKIMSVLGNPEVKGLSESVAKVQGSIISRGLLSHFGLRKENSGGA